MLIQLIRNLFNGDYFSIVNILMVVVVVLISLSVHECAHGLAAYKLGDPTAKSMGRLSLNPKNHLDPVGTLMMLLFGFGWAKPVPINPNYFKNRKRGMAITAFAGPLSNVLMAFLGVFAYHIIYTFAVGTVFTGYDVFWSGAGIAQDTGQKRFCCSCTDVMLLFYQFKSEPSHF